MRNDWKNTIIRALRTFCQAALGFAAANAAGVIGDGEGVTKNALAAFLVAAISAGLAALMNLPDHTGKVEGVEWNPESVGPAKKKVEDINESDTLASQMASEETQTDDPLGEGDESEANPEDEFWGAGNG